jgi:hypothetical protein
MGFLDRLFGKRPPAAATSGDDEPFMEHPTGDFPNAVAAMTDAIARLRALDSWANWITFGGQGQGARPDSMHLAEVRLLGDEIQLPGHEVDRDAVLKLAGLADAALDLEVRTGGSLRVGHATAEQLARLLDALFRGPLGVRPFDGETDYAVGAEW